jgi:hypothetical protein
VGIEKDVKGEHFWLCFPCVVNNIVSELDRTIYNSDPGRRIHVLETRHNFDRSKWKLVREEPRHPRERTRETSGSEEWERGGGI